MAKKSAAQELIEAVVGKPVASGEIPAGFNVVARSGNPFKVPGDIVTGVYGGPGEPLKLKGKRPIPTYRVGAVALLASSQISAFFDSIEPGIEVWIRFDGQVAGGKGRVNTYTFATRE